MMHIKRAINVEYVVVLWHYHVLLTLEDEPRALLRVFRQKSVFVLLHTVLKNAKVHTNLKHRRKKEKEKENVYTI